LRGLTDSLLFSGGLRKKMGSNNSRRTLKPSDSVSAKVLISVALILHKTLVFIQACNIDHSSLIRTECQIISIWRHFQWSISSVWT